MQTTFYQQLSALSKDEGETNHISLKKLSLQFSSFKYLLSTLKVKPL